MKCTWCVGGELTAPTSPGVTPLQFTCEHDVMTTTQQQC